MKTRQFLLNFFITINVLAFFAYSFGYINSTPINETKGISILLHLLNLVLLVLTLYIIINTFKYLEKNIQLKPLPYNLYNSYSVGIFIMCAQIVYLFVFVTQGGNVAGAKDTLGGGIFGIFSAILQLQTLSLLYLVSFPHKNRISNIIFILFIITNILQGWSGFILTITILFLFIQEIKGKIKSYFKVIFIALILIILFYPIIYFFRLTIRIMGQQNSTFENINLINAYGNGNLLDFMFYSYNKLIERFEQFYLSLGSLINNEQIAMAYSNGLITPFFVEGFQEKIFNSFGYFNNSYSMSNYLPSLFYNDSTLGEYTWNVSPGFTSLFYTGSWSVLFIIPYYTFLIFIIISILKLLKAPILSYHLVFYYLIILLFAGWFSQFFYFVWSFIILFLLIQFFGLIKALLINISRNGV